MKNRYLLIGGLSILVLACRSKSDASITYDTSMTTTTATRTDQPRPAYPGQPVMTQLPPGSQPPGQPMSVQSVPGGQPSAMVQSPNQPVPGSQPGQTVDPRMPAMPSGVPTPEVMQPETPPTYPPASSWMRKGDTLVSPTGLKCIDLKPGTGDMPKVGEFVSVSYTGKFPNGKQFDQSGSFTTQVGMGSVIAGWDEGVLTMRRGGKRRIIIPPSLAFGSHGSGKQIPPNSTLIFDVELTMIQQ